ncbi:lipocalin-like domain-containing protein [Bacteroidales bacterium OttesenSCG-928-L03]|nr:lipocalin-like domain-containing protein [Bacteroidales bacterium OttesenSCG-928-L03]
MKRMKIMKGMKIMKSRLLVYLSTCLLVYLFTCLLVSCDDSHTADINGMWQLRTIQDGEGNVQHLDSVFYSFQRKYVFSYTALITDGLGREAIIELYGYADYPDNETLHILMDETYQSQWALDALPWHAPEVEYKILSLDSKKLVLGQGNEIYSFTKY